MPAQAYNDTSGTKISKFKQTFNIARGTINEQLKDFCCLCYNFGVLTPSKKFCCNAHFNYL